MRRCHRIGRCCRPMQRPRSAPWKAPPSALPACRCRCARPGTLRPARLRCCRGSPGPSASMSGARIGARTPSAHRSVMP
nr:MAG TPA: hypothetical protein [Caudoviricetes sp.]